jgi:hypothetical protein
VAVRPPGTGVGIDCAGAGVRDPASDVPHRRQKFMPG